MDGCALLLFRTPGLSALARQRQPPHLRPHTHTPTLQWLQKFIPHASPQRPLHVVDIGCGGGDTLRRIEQWAASIRLPLRLTGIDINPLAIQAAREFTAPNSTIQWRVGESSSVDYGAGPIDLIISSLFTHHLSEAEIPRFLSWMDNIARLGWFINDLYRSRVSYLAFCAMAPVARWHPFVRHDGPVSIRRAFRPLEWKQYIKSAGLPEEGVNIDVRWPARICVEREKQP